MIGTVLVHLVHPTAQGPHRRWPAWTLLRTGPVAAFQAGGATLLAARWSRPSPLCQGQAAARSLCEPPRRPRPGGWRRAQPWEARPPRAGPHAARDTT